MGGFIHLFDFNQALEGRKMLTDRKCRNGLDAARNSLDAASGTAEAPKISAAKANQVPQFEFHVCTTSVQNKSNGIPIKALRDKELSNEVEPKNRASNVVAQLMGLDALPTNLKTVQKPTMMVAVDKVTTKTKPEKLQNEKKIFRNRTADYLQGSRASKFHQQYDADWKAQKALLPFSNHPQGKQFQGFKREFKAWHSQSSRKCTRSARLEKIDMKVDAKEMLVCEELNEGKLALAHEKVSRIEHTEGQEGFHESIEIQDAVDFLQSNKDIFLRFLQEPSSLLSRQLHSQQSNLKPSVQPIQTSKPKSVDKERDSNLARKYGSKDVAYGREFVESRRRYKFDLNSQTRCAPDLGLDNSIPQGSPVPSLGDDASPLLSHDQEMQFSPMYGDNKTHGMGCQVPTRIVVLKPCPGKVRNLQSLSSLTKFREARVGARDYHQDAFLELRKRLMKEGREYMKGGRRHVRPNFCDHFTEGPQDPREIAREIARQVRESVSRDLLIDTGTVRSVQSNHNAIAAGRINIITGDKTGSSGESYIPSRRHPLDLQNREVSIPLISPCQIKSFEAQNIANSKEGKKRFQGKLKIQSVELSEQQQYQLQRTSLRKSCPYDCSQQISACSKFPHVSKAYGKGTTGDHISNQHSHTVKDALKSKGLLKADIVSDRDGLAGIQIGGESKDCSPRSRSVSVVDGEHVTLQIKRTDEGVSPSHEVTMDKAVSKSAVESNRIRSDADMRSVFSKKLLSLKGSLTLSRKRAVSKKPVSQTFLPHYGSAVAENGNDAPVQNKPVHLEVSSLASLPSRINALDESGDNLEISPGHDGQAFQGAVGNIDLKDSEPPTKLIDLEHRVSSRKTEHSIDTIDHSSQSLFASSLPDKTEIGAFKASSEKLEQPSPVSVLDIPFTEEVSSPVNLKELHSDLQELRLRLFLLKDGDCQISEPDLETRREKNVLAADGRAEMDVDNCSPSGSESEMMVDTYFPLTTSEFLNCGNTGVDQGVCADGKKPQIAYVKNILITSGFVGDSDIVFKRWHAPSSPLDPHLFQMMELPYCNQRVAMNNIGEPNKMRKMGDLHEFVGTFNRQLLFDCLNEILFEILGPYLKQHPWVNCSKVPVYPMPSGNKLVDLVLIEVDQFLNSCSESQATLETLVAKDLAKSGLWMDFTDAIETVGLELESIIVNDLIEEAIISLVM